MEVVSAVKDDKWDDKDDDKRDYLLDGEWRQGGRCGRRRHLLCSH